jgi:Ca2+/Na+ antiporter
MNDTFMEKIVQRRKTGQDYMKIVGLLLASFVLLTALMLFGGYVSFLVPFLLVGLFYGLWYLLTSMNKEYEYIVTNGELDIDCIIARRKRRRVFSGKAREFEIMASLDSDDYKYAEGGRLVKLDFSPHIAAPGNWFFICEYKGERTMVIFQPDERMLGSMKRYNPSKIKYNKIGA